MKQGGSIQRPGSPKIILGQMDYQETQSSCHFHEPFGPLAAPDGSGFVMTRCLKLSLLTGSSFTANLYSVSASKKSSALGLGGNSSKYTMEIRYQASRKCRYRRFLIEIFRIQSQSICHSFTSNLCWKIGSTAPAQSCI